MFAAWAPGGIHEPFQATTVGSPVLLQTYASDKNTAIVSSSDLKTPLKSSKNKDMAFNWQYPMTPAIYQSGSEYMVYYSQEGYLTVGSLQGNGVKQLPDVTFDGYYTKQLNKAVIYKNRPGVPELGETNNGLFNCGKSVGASSATFAFGIPIEHFKALMSLPADKPMPEKYMIQINSISFYILRKPDVPITNLKITIYVQYQPLSSVTVANYMPSVEEDFDTIAFTQVNGRPVDDKTPIAVIISYEYSDNKCLCKLYNDYPNSASFSYAKNLEENVFTPYYGTNPIDILPGRDDEAQGTVRLNRKPIIRFASVISSKEIQFFNNSVDMTVFPSSEGKLNIFSVSNYDASLQGFDFITMRTATEVTWAYSTSYFKKFTFFLACCAVVSPAFKQPYAAVIETNNFLERSSICFYNSNRLSELRDPDSTVLFLQKKLTSARTVFVANGTKDILGGTSGDRIFVFYDIAPYVSAFRVTEVTGGVNTTTIAIPATLTNLLGTLGAANPILPTPISDNSLAIIKRNLLPEPEPPVTPENIVIYRRLTTAGTPSSAGTGVRPTLPFLIPVINPRAAIQTASSPAPAPAPATHAPDMTPAPVPKELLLLRNMRGFLEGQSRSDLQAKRRILERLESLEQRMLSYGQQGQQVGEEEYRVFQTELRLLHSMIQNSGAPEDVHAEIQAMKWSLPPVLDGRATRRIFERLENLEQRMLSYARAGQQITEEAAEAFRTELNVLRRMMAEAKAAAPTTP